MDDHIQSIEIKTLKNVQSNIDFHLKRLKGQLKVLRDSYDDLHDYISQNYATMDDEEKGTQLTLLNDAGEKHNRALEEYERLEYLTANPYFGGVSASFENSKENFLIGPNNIFNKEMNYPCVLDWRAPICNLYYDYGLGEAECDTPSGIVKCNITAKKNYKIADGKILKVMNTTSATSDVFLEETLAEASSTKMKTIIATIQKQQNKIIRDDLANTLIVQGVAGSGKTSIALHRVAYLLYKNRDTLKSSDFCLISPNNIFSDYISNVLPELGEAAVLETTFESLVKEELSAYLGAFETRAEMMERLYNNRQSLNDIAKKGSFLFLEDLLTYLNAYFDTQFEPTDLKFDGKVIKRDTLAELFSVRFAGKIPSVKLDWIADYCMDEWDIAQNLTGVSARIKRLLYPMLKNIDIEDIYMEFLNTQKLKYEKINGKIAFDDIGGLMLIKYYIIGLNVRSEVKYLLIDEMQDFTPIHFYLFEKIFPCKKIVLGDIYQSLDRSLDETYLTNLQKLIYSSKIIQLDTCYRCSYEICKFAEKLLSRISINAVLRHGKDVEVMEVDDLDNQIKLIKSTIKKWQKCDGRFAVITPSEKQAVDIFAQLSEFENVQLIQEGQPLGRVQITPVGLSKGLEFDKCLLVGFNMDSDTEFDRNQLFVAVTRALHELQIVTLK